MSADNKAVIHPDTNVQRSIQPAVWKLVLVLVITLVVMTAAPWGPGIVQAQSLKVTLLGTGAPPPVMERFGPSTLVEAGAEKLIFDAGRGALQRLVQLKTPVQPC